MRLLRIRRLSCAVVVAGLLAASGGALAQDVKNSINLAVGALPPFGDAKGTIVLAEYERLLTSKLSVYGRFSALDYNWDDGFYEEDGTGRGLGIGVRFFPQSGLKGFYVGGGIGTFKSKWDWKDKGVTGPTGSGKGETSSIQWGGEVGYRFNLGSPRVSLTPALNVGSWLGADDKSTYSNGQTATKTSEAGFYVVISVALGIAF